MITVLFVERINYFLINYNYNNNYYNYLLIIIIN